MTKRTTRVVYNQLSPILLSSTTKNRLINENVLQQLSSVQQKQQEENLVITSKLGKRSSNNNVTIFSRNQETRIEERLRKRNADSPHCQLPKLKLRNGELTGKREDRKVLNLTQYLIMSQEQKSKSKQQKKQGTTKISVKKYHIIVQEKSGREKRTKYFRSIGRRNKTDIHGSLEKLEPGISIQAQVCEIKRNKCE